MAGTESFSNASGARRPRKAAAATHARAGKELRPTDRSNSWCGAREGTAGGGAKDRGRRLLAVATCENGSARLGCSQLIWAGGPCFPNGPCKAQVGLQFSNTHGLCGPLDLNHRRSEESSPGRRGWLYARRANSKLTV